MQTVVKDSVIVFDLLQNRKLNNGKKGWGKKRGVDEDLSRINELATCTTCGASSELGWRGSGWHSVRSEKKNVG